MHRSKLDVAAADELFPELGLRAIHPGNAIALQYATGAAARDLLRQGSGVDPLGRSSIEILDTHPRQVYDATALLGFGEQAREPIIVGEPDEVVIRYGGWSLMELFHSSTGGDLIHEQDWWKHYLWANHKIPAGIYAMRLPIPESNHKQYRDQTHLLHGQERTVPIVLGASALIAQHLKGGENHLKHYWTRCKERSALGHAALSWYGNGLDISDHGDACFRKQVWMSSYRRIGYDVD